MNASVPCRRFAPERRRRQRARLLALVLGLPVAAAVAQPRALAPYADSIPGTLVSFEMVPVPGGKATVPGPSGSNTVQVAAFWIGRTELTWDAFDVFALGLDRPAAATGADAVARPSKPYGAPDRGFGHQGYAAISVTRAAAEAFCRWLSSRTGKTYRLPTEAEWQRAGDLALGSGSPAGRLDRLAWHAGNAEGRPHPVGRKEPDALGLHDLFGNVAEWVVSADSQRVLRGGSYRDPADRLGVATRAVQEPSWTETDPQIPKSRWWLSDGPFAGFRIVREQP